MCRSKANGGRRCTGRTANANTSSTSSSASRTSHDTGEYVNIADGNDFVPVQVGRFVSAEDTPTLPPVVPPSTSTDSDADVEEVRVVNVRADNARVGAQADTITGPIHIRW